MTLLPDREIATVAAWLADHPSIEILARGRGGGYGEAAAEALPNAIQTTLSLALDGECEFRLSRRGAQIDAGDPRDGCRCQGTGSSTHCQVGLAAGIVRFLVRLRGLRTAEQALGGGD